MEPEEYGVHTQDTKNDPLLSGPPLRQSVISFSKLATKLRGVFRASVKKTEMLNMVRMIMLPALLHSTD